jgi:uncharacterized membrane protein
MDIVLVVVRLLHIVAGVFWVGAGLYAALILVPTLVRMGTEASSVMRSLGQSAVFRAMFPVSAVLTVLAGIILYLRPNASAVFSNTGWIVLSIGALAGILAAVHGGAVLGRMQGEYWGKVSSGSASPSELESLGQSLILHMRISLILAVVALIGMALARYL